MIFRYLVQFKQQNKPEIVVQLEVRRGRHSLVHGPYNVRARQTAQGCRVTPWIYHQFEIPPFAVSPFVVLAVEKAVENVAEGADVVEVVQDDHCGELCVCLLCVALLCQAGQVLTELLQGKNTTQRRLDSEKFTQNASNLTSF